ncbi:MAG: hypothetical protein H8E15_16525 [Planctomycetes bacterium]|nr:hypothetical protein [Planctomycetota bacterium]
MRCTSLAAAGRTLIAGSWKRKATQNGSDRLKKYLARFELTWADLKNSVNLTV